MKELNGQYDEINVYFIGPFPDMVSDSDEIMIDNIKRPRITEAYTIVHLPADCDGKTNASIQVKFNTRAGGNVMPLRVFERLYPKQMNLNVNQQDWKPASLKLLYIMECKFHNMECLDVC